MIRPNRIGTAGLCVIALTVLSACDGASVGAALDTTADELGSTLVPSDTDEQPEGDDVIVPADSDVPADSGTPDQPDTVDNLDDSNESDESADTGESSEPDTTNEADEASEPDTSTEADAGEATDPDPSTGTDEQVADVSASGSDQSNSEDDSVVPAETASLVGPFTKDTSRSAGPPSVPQDLTLLLSGERWLEFTWAPSSDDQSVEAYEIYRDGQLLATVRGDTGYEHDYRSWLSTSYIDCNYTRYTTCESVQPVPGSTYSYTVVAVDNEGMKSANSAAALFTLAQRGTAPVDLTGYAKVFSEEFDGTVLDRSRWKTVLPWGEDETINNETQHFVNIFGNDPMDYDPFVFTGETLQITGINTPAELAAEANNQPYLSGVLTTSDNFAMTYGYVEMNAKFAGGEGLLSTFFLFNQDFEKNKPEIDIVEYIGSRPDKAYHTYHYYDSNRARYFSGEKHSSPTMETVYSTPLSDAFHTYSVLWEPELVIWYIDGIEVRRLTGPRVSDEPMNIITQLVIGSEWIGAPAASSIPAILEIDYIRAWQQQ